MHPNQVLRKAVKGFYAYIGSVLAAVAGPLLGTQLIHQQSTALRAAGVAAGVGGWVPLLLLTAALIRASDEFSQRIHYLALSLAFASGLILITLADWLVRADFIEPVPYTVVSLALVALWAISLFIAKRRIERGSTTRARLP
jgi:hypothetical protein